MSGIFIGNGNVARKVNKIYLGVNGIARKVKTGHLGHTSGKARRFMNAVPVLKTYTIFSNGYGFNDVATNDGYQSEMQFSIGNFPVSNNDDYWLELTIVSDKTLVRSYTIWHNYTLLNSKTVGNINETYLVRAPESGFYSYQADKNKTFRLTLQGGGNYQATKMDIFSTFKYYYYV